MKLQIWDIVYLGNFYLSRAKVKIKAVTKFVDCESYMYNVIKSEYSLNDPFDWYLHPNNSSFWIFKTKKELDIELKKTAIRYIKWKRSRIENIIDEINEIKSKYLPTDKN